MTMVETMYDYRHTRETAKHICKVCNEPISDEEYEEYDGWCEYCNRHERLSYECERCGKLITETDYCLQDFMCNECYDEVNDN